MNAAQTLVKVPRDLNLLLSFLLSVTYTSFIGLLNLTRNVALVLYMIPLAFFIAAKVRFRRIRPEIPNGQGDVFTLSLNKESVFTLIVLLCAALISFLVYFQNFGLRGDLWRVFSDATFISSHGLSNYAMYYPYFMLSFFSQSFSLNSYHLMSFLLMVSASIVFTTLALKTAVLRLSGSRKFAIVASVIWLTFSGFDWVYVVTSGGSDVNSLLYNVGTSHLAGVIYQLGTFGFDHILFVIGLGAALVAIALVSDIRIDPAFRYPAIAVTTFLAYACYVQEGVVLVYGFFALHVLMERKQTRRLILEGISILVGLLGVGLYANLSGALLGYYADFTLLPIHVGFLLGLLGIVGVFARKNLIASGLSAFWNRIQIVNSNLRFAVAFALLHFFLLSLLIETLFLGYLPIWPFWDYFPLFHYPAALGIVGVLSILPVVGWALNRRRLSPFVRFSLFSVLWLIIIAELFGWFNVGRSSHLASWIFVFASGVAAVVIVRLIGQVRQIKKTAFRKPVLAMMITGFFLVGSFSSVMGVAFWEAKPGPYIDPGTEISIGKGDERLLNYLSAEASREIFSVASSSQRANQLAALAGVRTLSDYQNGALFNSVNPLSVFRVFQDQSVQYLLVEKNSSANAGYIGNHLLKNLSPVSVNDGTELYQVRKFNPPSEESRVGLVYPFEMQDDFVYYATESVALSNISYTVFDPNDPSQLNANVLILPSDTGRTGWEFSSSSKITSMEGTSERAEDTLVFTASASAENHDLIIGNPAVSMTEFPHLAISWATPNASSGSDLWLLLHSSIGAWHYIYLGKSETIRTQCIDLFDFESHGSSITGYSPEPVRHDSLGTDERVDSIALRTYGAEARFELKSMKLVSTPLWNEFDYMDWIRKGGRLIVFASTEEGEFSEFAEDSSFVQQKTLPSVYTGQVGEGYLTVISLGDYVANMRNTEERSRDSLFWDLGLILRPLLPEADNFEMVHTPILWGSPAPPGQMIFGQASFEGLTTIRANGAYFFDIPHNASRVVLSGIESVMSRSLRMVENSRGPYAAFRFEEDAEVLSTDGNRTVIPVGSILEVKNPLVCVNGSVSMENAWSFSFGGAETPFLRGVKVQASGDFAFKVLDESIGTTAAMFVSGRCSVSSSASSLYVGHPPVLLYSSIPWLSLQMISLNVVVASALGLAFAFYALSRRRKAGVS
ncbi:MAG: hypothetical protein ACE14S_09975 [Candidatus Bathyarchaeia archaeon]